MVGSSSIKSHPLQARQNKPQASAGCHQGGSVFSEPPRLLQFSLHYILKQSPICEFSLACEDETKVGHLLFRRWTENTAFHACSYSIWYTAQTVSAGRPPGCVLSCSHLTNLRVLRMKDYPLQTQGTRAQGYRTCLPLTELLALLR